MAFELTHTASGMIFSAISIANSFLRVACPTPAKDSVESVIKSFLDGVGYKPKPWVIDDKFVEAAYNKAKASGIIVEDYERLDNAIAYACLTSPYQTFEVKMHIALHTWVAIVIDDGACATPADLPLFPQRFYSNLPQPTPLLTAYAQNLHDIYLYYDPIVASQIIQSWLSYVDCCNLDSRAEYQSMPRTKGGEAWAYYFRAKDGIVDAYAWYNFTKMDCPDVSAFCQALPDMGKYIGLTNDILSFYKEEKAGVTRNYIRTRAECEGKEALVVLKEVVEETIAAYRRASEILKGQGKAEKAWHAYAHGYIAFHTTQPRYKLHQIGLGENIVREKKL